jgi:hypothetical protein
MIDKNNIDEAWRQRLEQAEVPAPAFVWPAVERELRKKKRGYPFFWLAFALVSVGGFIQHRNLGTKNIAASIPVQSLVTKADQGLALAKPESASGIESGVAQGDNTAGPTTARPVSVQKTVVPKPNFSTKNSPLTKPAVQQLNFVEVQVDKSINRIDKTPASVEPLEFASESTLYGKNPELVLVGQSPNASNKPNAFTQAPAALLLSDLKPLEYWDKITLPSIKSNQNVKRFAPRKRKSKYCYDFTRNTSVWMFDAYFGPSLAQKNLSTSAEYGTYLKHRLNSEENSLSFNAGLRANFIFNQNMMLRTGAHFERINEVFQFIDPKYTKYSVEIYVDNNGNTRVDTVGVEFGQNYVKTFNRLSLVDIPVQGAYELRFGRGGVSLNAGLSFNMLFHKRGGVRTIDGESWAPFTPGKPDAIEMFRPRLGMSFMGSVQWFYYIEPRSRVFLETYHRNIFGSVTLLSHPVTQRYNISGLRMGVSRIID